MSPCVRVEVCAFVHAEFTNPVRPLSVHQPLTVSFPVKQTLFVIISAGCIKYMNHPFAVSWVLCRLRTVLLVTCLWALCIGVRRIPGSSLPPFHHPPASLRPVTSAPPLSPSLSAQVSSTQLNKQHDFSMWSLSPASLSLFLNKSSLGCKGSLGLQPQEGPMKPVTQTLAFGIHVAITPHNKQKTQWIISFKHECNQMKKKKKNHNHNHSHSHNHNQTQRIRATACTENFFFFFFSVVKYEWGKCNKKKTKCQMRGQKETSLRDKRLCGRNAGMK